MHDHSVSYRIMQNFAGPYTIMFDLAGLGRIMMIIHTREYRYTQRNTNEINE